jgi:hypothetical protein
MFVIKLNCPGLAFQDGSDQQQDEQLSCTPEPEDESSLFIFSYFPNSIHKTG